MELFDRDFWPDACMIYDVPPWKTEQRKYFQFWDGDEPKNMPLYHWLWINTYGVEIPDGWVLHHECEVGACCNPTHMRPMENAAHGRYHAARRHLLTR